MYKRDSVTRTKIAAGRIAALDAFEIGNKVRWGTRRGEIVALQGEAAAVVLSDGKKYLCPLRDLERA